MPIPAATAVARQIQDLRAESLATLIAALGEVSAVAAIAGTTAGAGQGGASAGAGGEGIGASGQLAASSAVAEGGSETAAIRAVIIATLADGRAVLAVAGGTVEAELPPELVRAGAADPSLIKPGAVVALPAGTPTRPVAPPATLLVLSSGALTAPSAAPSVGPVPPLAAIFPPGSVGAAITRLTGIAFPAAEPDAAPAAGEAQALQRPLPGRATPPGLPPTNLAALPAELGAALLRAARQQVPLAAALRDLVRFAAEAPPGLSPTLTSALQDLAALRSEPAALGSAEALRAAVQKSGLFLEAKLAAAGEAPVAPDLKSILLSIRALAAGERAPPGGPADLAHRAAGETAAQGGGPARGPAGAGPALEIQRAAEGALERVKLMQMASAPAHPEMSVTDDRAAGLRLALALPLATQGVDRPPTAILGLVIEHQPQPAAAQPYAQEAAGGSAEQAFPWKIRLALDLAETGPVQVEIGLRGQAVAVTLWAERPGMAQAARREIGELHSALVEAAFDVRKLDVKDGRPAGAALRSGPLVDRRT